MRDRLAAILRSLADRVSPPDDPYEGLDSMTARFYSRPPVSWGGSIYPWGSPPCPVCGVFSLGPTHDCVPVYRRVTC